LLNFKLKWSGSKLLRTQEEIEKKIADIETTLKDLDPSYEHFTKVYNAQKYALEWVLGKTG
jgi:hypothetical protein